MYLFNEILSHIIRVNQKKEEKNFIASPTSRASRSKQALLKLAFSHARVLITYNEVLQRQKRYLANVGIEPKTFALLARRSNQLS